MVAAECMFTWYWLADLCAQEGIAFVLGHALSRKAIHGGKAQNDRIDALKIATLLRGGMLPQPYVYPPGMRATRDLLRRRLHLVRKRGQLLAHIQNTNHQYNPPAFGKRIANREGVAEHFGKAAMRKSVEVDLELPERYGGGRSEDLEFSEPAFEGEGPDTGSIQRCSDRLIKKVPAVEEDVVVHVVVDRHHDLGVSRKDLLSMVAMANAKEGDIASASIRNVEDLITRTVHDSGRHLQVNVVLTKWIGPAVCERHLEPIVVPLRLDSLLRVRQLDLGGEVYRLGLRPAFDLRSGGGFCPRLPISENLDWIPGRIVVDQLGTVLAKPDAVLRRLALFRAE